MAKHEIIVIKKGEWGAFVPDLPGCVVKGETEEDVMLGIQERIKSRLDEKVQHRILWIIFGILPMAFLFAVLTFKGFSITVDTIDGRVLAIESRWWGFVKKEREIRWMDTGEYIGGAGWMTKDQNGKWYLYIVENDGPDY